ncbi:MAG: hypothetical protein SPL13_01990, partial [Clostridia bacterium]|nr:hypothetical protein [Clostridia bacterium]
TIIYLESARSERLSISPCVFVLPDFEKDIDEDYLFELAKCGYFAVAADFSGKKEGKNGFTVYPSEVEYANYEIVKNSLYEISDDVKHSAWYEWGSVAKYVVNYLSSRSVVTGVGAIGVGLGASVLWEIAANENNLACAVFLFDAGWNAYFKKGNKKSDGVSPEFNDDDLKFLAGVDAQAYASSVKIPTLVISATNSVSFDFDRAADTVQRMNKAQYAAIDYSVNRVSVLDASAHKDISYFLSEILLKGKKAENMPSLPEIECYTEDGEIEIEIDAAEEGLKKVVLYAAEGDEVQQLRSWKIAGEIFADEYCDGQFVFRYLPYQNSGICSFFVRAVYESGFTVASPVATKKFAPTDVKTSHKSKLIYSGREKFSASAFAPCFEKVKIFESEGTDVTEVKGPMDIVGLKATCGLITFKVNSEKDKPADDSIFVLDVCADEGADITFSLLTGNDFKGMEFSAKISCPSARSWRNFTLPLAKFKSAEGMGIKGFDEVTAIKITADKPFLINNFLWI